MKRTSVLQTCLLLILSMLVATTALATESSSPDDAKRHFSAGMAYLNDPSGPKLEEAYLEFRAAYELQPAYMILTNIGYCALHLERDVDAIAANKEVLEKATAADMSPRQRKQMESDVQMLSAGLVTVTLRTVPNNLMIMDERFSSSGPVRVNRYPIVEGTSQLGIHPGSHRFTATADGYEPQTWEFEAAPASAHTHDFRLQPIGTTKAAQPIATVATISPTTPPPGMASQLPRNQSNETPTAVYVGGAITGVFALATAVTGLLAVSKKSDYDDTNRDGAHPGEAQSLRDDAKRFAVYSDISLGGTVLAAGVTTYLYLTGSERPRDKQTSRTDIRLSPNLGTNRGGLTLSAQF